MYHIDSIGKLDKDTCISHDSFSGASKAAGVVIAAVDAVMKKTCQTAFCAIRPPGHHVGPRGAVEYYLLLLCIIQLELQMQKIQQVLDFVS